MMNELTKITRNSDNRAFDWLLEKDNNACYDLANSMMIRKLVERHNQMVDHIIELEKKFKELSDEAEAVANNEGNGNICSTCGKHIRLNAMTPVNGLCTCNVKANM